MNHPQEVAKTVRKSLEASAYRVLRTVSVRFERGVLVLRGRLPSYFHKQLAQEAVRGIDGVDRIVNEVEVPVRPAPRAVSGQGPAPIPDIPDTQAIEEVLI